MSSTTKGPMRIPSLSEEDWNDLGIELLSLHFMDQVKKCFPQPFKNKDLAAVIGKSPAYVSQLCSGSRLLNLKTLHAIQKGTNVSFGLLIRHDPGHPNFRQSVVVSGSQFLCVSPSVKEPSELTGRLEEILV